MSEFSKMYERNPHIFVCDMSFALINAAVRVFGEYPSIVEYIEIIFHLINRLKKPIKISPLHTNLIKTPPCLIRIDLAHLMNLISKNKALNAPGTRKKVKDFYMRCVAILVQCTSMDFAATQIRSILIVAMSKTEGRNICQYLILSIIIL